MIAGGPAIRTVSLGCDFGARTALDGLDLDVSSGSVFALLGPNGSGKSTLLRILSTLLVPTRGTAVVNGDDVVRDPARVRRSLGVVFQNVSLDRQLTVRENLSLCGTLHGLRGAERARRIDAMLERFDLRDRAGDRVGVLSGGLARRADLARAMLHSPRVLLLDEPTTGLDPAARRALLDTLLRARDESGTTSLLATQLPDEAERCDGVALLDGGRLLAAGPPRELVREIGGESVTLVVDDGGAIETAAAIERRFGVRAISEAGTLRFSRENAAEFLPELLAAVPGRVRSATVASPTLEDVFFRRTGRRFDVAGARGDGE